MEKLAEIEKILSAKVNMFLESRRNTLTITKKKESSLLENLEKLRKEKE